MNDEGRLAWDSDKFGLAHQGINKIAYQRRAVDSDVKVDATSSMIERDQQRCRHDKWVASTVILVWFVWFRSRR